MLLVFFFFGMGHTIAGLKRTTIVIIVAASLLSASSKPQQDRRKGNDGGVGLAEETGNNGHFPEERRAGDENGGESGKSGLLGEEAASEKGNLTGGESGPEEPQRREIEEAVEYGLKAMKELVEVKEPFLYKLGLYLDKDHPAARVAAFSAPSRQSLELARYGYATLEASRKLAEAYPNSPLGKRRTELPPSLRSTSFSRQCPLHGNPRCAEASRRYRTADGTCNSFEFPWRGASLLPMIRFLPPAFDDGVQSIRRSVFGSRLPSPREISVRVHRDRDREMPGVTLMLVQWGQFVDHDMLQSAQATSFNNSIPRCCGRGGTEFLPQELLHPSCLPIEVPSDDWFLGQFGIRCMEFLRSAPTTRIDCDLGWREQINQVTPYIDASTIYGSDPRTAQSTRLFRNGLLAYGRPRGQGPLRPPDPPGGELCRAGAITTECFNSGDGRVGEQPGLTAFHTLWVRYHNKIADSLQRFNPHWSDEKVYQEARKIVGALVQHITYREFLPLVVGQEVMDLFGLTLLRQGYYKGHDPNVNPTVANSFAAAAFRFGHSLVQRSYVRFDTKHRPLFNNVTLHEEQGNVRNIWSLGSVDRLLLGLCNQPSQRRDEFISEELTNHLFQSSGKPFGMDLAAINIQRGRDHGIPAYVAWRVPCGLSAIKGWGDLDRVMPPEAAKRLKSLYASVEDIDLYTGGLAEHPVRGGIVGPTFACIIAQQFANLRKGDRFWYENGGLDSSFTPAQLQQLRKVTFSQVICRTMDEVETLQPFVMLTADAFRNVRLRCDSPMLEALDLGVWAERGAGDVADNELKRRVDTSDVLNVDFEDIESARAATARKKKRRTKTTTTTRRPKLQVKTTRRPAPIADKVQYTNVTVTANGVKTKYGTDQETYVLTNIPLRPQYEDFHADATYNQPTRRPYSADRYTTTQKPLEVNIKIQYFAQAQTSQPTYRPYAQTTTPKRRKTTTTTRRPYYSAYQATTRDPYGGYGQIAQRPQRPQDLIDRPNIYHFPDSNDYWIPTRRPYIRPQPLNSYNDRPQPYHDDPPPTKYPSYLYLNQNDDDRDHARPYQKRPQQHGYSYDQDKDDAFEEMYSETMHSEVFADHIPKRPNFPYYDTDKRHKDDTHRLPQVLVDKNDKSYVKISSIEGDILTKRHRFQAARVMEKGKVSAQPDAATKQTGESNWLHFNATDGEAPAPLMPAVDEDVDLTFANEIPHPMNVTFNNDRRVDKTATLTESTSDNDLAGASRSL